ncbi:hypothetical protein EYF80_009272 [Liparis tanakae]|uniref:Uncharacterized protein n=1 Tax=Liparis tanakae TaxID=230148 RepID=A0A4Z2ITL1_9TELE|nr:hypothetical protein EYF80_009272 [Liparis tanakae]
MDSNRNQPRNTHHQGSQQLADLFFFFSTGSGLSQGGGKRRGRMFQKAILMAMVQSSRLMQQETL